MWIEIGNIINHKRTDLSLPLRECGLKCSTRHQKQERLLSLPLWECGLKSELDAYRLSAYASLPLWECGLKLSSWITMQSPDLVTPLVRVWIEIA